MTDRSDVSYDTRLHHPPEDEMTGANCPMCASPACQPTGYAKAEFHLFQCEQCDLQFFEPMRNPGSQWYEVNARSRDLLEADSVNWNHRQFLRRQPSSGGRILDVGCGTGGFLVRAQRAGYRVAGLDFDDKGVLAARSRLGVADVHAWSLEEYIAERPDDRFDAVTAFEVLEHQDDPRRFLELCYSVTRPGGYFAVSVPFRDRWPSWKYEWDEPPHHLTRWSQEAILSALRQTGFDPVEYRTGWQASGQTLMGKVRFGIVQRDLDLMTQTDDPVERRRLRSRAAVLNRAKTAIFGAIGRPIDLGLKAVGATGIDMYLLAVRRERETSISA